MCLDISYYEEYKRVISSGSYKQKTWRGERGELTQKFAWAVPNEECVRYLANESKNEPIIEIGAGNGYWSYNIQKVGGEIIPIDIKDYDDSWTDVIIGSHRSLDSSKINKIMLCWPPAKSPMALKTVKSLKPQDVYFVGVKNSSITGDTEFHEYLSSNFEAVNEINVPSWSTRNVKLIKYSFNKF